MSTEKNNPLAIVNPNSSSSKEPWYKDGLHFGCTQCGKCCTGSPGYTWVSLDEINIIADHLKIPINDFIRDYLRKVDGKWALLEYTPSYDCIFLKDKRCSIYQVRPKQCRTFPWWPKNLESKKNWEKTATHCEGINNDAPLVTYDEIAKQSQ